MGYTTEFDGQLAIEPPLRPEHRTYLQRFSQTRRVKRDSWLAERLPDPVRVAADLPIGPEGSYFVGSYDDFSGTDPSVIDVNTPHAPFTDSLYCSWAPHEDGSALGWTGAEMFYEYATWLEFLVRHFLGPWRYRLNGRIDWQGDDPDDRGRIFVRDNVLVVVPADITVQDPFVDS